MNKVEILDGKDFTFLVGKSIKDVKAGVVSTDYGETEGYILTCHDGTIIEVGENEGCGGCDNGWSHFDELMKLKDNNNVITNVKVTYDYDLDEDMFEMFVLYEDGTYRVLNGNDGYGNGYYGGGFHVTIKNVNVDGLKDNNLKVEGNDIEDIKKLFKDLGFNYKTFWADMGYRDIFFNSNGEQIIFYEEELNGLHYYHSDVMYTNLDLHNAIVKYMKYKWGI